MLLLKLELIMRRKGKTSGLGISLTIYRAQNSGKKKAHKHKSFWPVTPPVTGGSPDREARGQSFMCYPRNPRNINLFCPDTRPGRPVTRATGEFYVQKFYVPFLLPINPETPKSLKKVSREEFGTPPDLGPPKSSEKSPESPEKS